MEKILLEITIIIQKYKDLGDKLDFNDCETLSIFMKDLSSNLFFLESHRDTYSRKFNSILHSHIKSGSAVSKAEIIAKEATPELYMLRRIMTSAYKSLDAIRSHISFLKQER